MSVDARTRLNQCPTGHQFSFLILFVFAVVSFQRWNLLNRFEIDEYFNERNVPRNRSCSARLDRTLVIMSGMGGSGSRGLSTMIRVLKAVHAPVSNNPGDYYFWGPTRRNTSPDTGDLFLPLNNRKQDVPKPFQIRSILDASVLKREDIKTIVSVQYDKDSEKDRSPLDWRRRRPLFDPNDRRICGKVSDEFSEAFQRVVSTFENSICGLLGHKELRSRDKSHLVVKAGKLSLAIPAICEAVKRTIGEDGRLKLLLYVRNGLDMAFSTNRYQLRFVRSALHFEFRDIHDIVMRDADDLVRRRWTEAMEAIGYNHATDHFYPTAEGRFVQRAVRQGVYWALLYLHAEDCLHRCAETEVVDTIVVRFEDFVGSDAKQRRREIERVVRLLGLYATRDEILSMEASYERDAIDGTALDSAKLREKWKRHEHGSLVAAALLSLPGFRRVMNRFGYETPDVSGLLRDSQ